MLFGIILFHRVDAPYRGQDTQETLQVNQDSIKVHTKPALPFSAPYCIILSPMHILIITGGSSSEREISLISAENVQRTLKANGHSVTMFDFQEGYGALGNILETFDVVFPVMHGKEGEDGTLYQFLASANKPFVGSDPAGAKIAFDKVLFKRYCDEQQILTAPWSLVTNEEDIVKFGFPCVLKAANGGSSHEVAPIFTQADLRKENIQRILHLPDTRFVEGYLQGVEITVGVLLDEPLPAIEITPPSGGWFDYQHKYSGESQETPFAPSVEAGVQKQAQQIALQIHQNLHLRSFSRTDFIIVDSVPCVLEVNTPGGVGLTPGSLFPKAAKAAEISFETFVERVIMATMS